MHRIEKLIAKIFPTKRFKTFQVFKFHDFFTIYENSLNLNQSFCSSTTLYQFHTPSYPTQTKLIRLKFYIKRFCLFQFNFQIHPAKTRAKKCPKMLFYVFTILVIWIIWRVNEKIRQDPLKNFGDSSLPIIKNSLNIARFNQGTQVAYQPFFLLMLFMCSIRFKF